MWEQSFESGDIIYREGDLGDKVFVIQEGCIEVLRGDAGAELRLALLGKGEIFGEMGVINDQPRSTTVRAVERTSLVTIPRDEFLKVFSKDNPLALKILRMLCGRILRADEKLLSQKLYSDAAREADVERIRLLPASPGIESQIGSDGIEIGNLPFSVGRSLHARRTADNGGANLKISLPNAVHLSPQHFSIEAEGGRLRLRDLHSGLGTLVNGHRIARFEQFETADLHLGANEIQAGGIESPYRFSLILETASAG